MAHHQERWSPRRDSGFSSSPSPNSPQLVALRLLAPSLPRWFARSLPPSLPRSLARSLAPSLSPPSSERTRPTTPPRTLSRMKMSTTPSTGSPDHTLAVGMPATYKHVWSTTHDIASNASLRKDPSIDPSISFDSCANRGEIEAKSRRNPADSHAEKGSRELRVSAVRWCMLSEERKGKERARETGRALWNSAQRTSSRQLRKVRSDSF